MVRGMLIPPQLGSEDALIEHPVIDSAKAPTRRTLIHAAIAANATGGLSDASLVELAGQPLNLIRL